MKNKILGAILLLSVAMVGNAAVVGSPFDSSEKKRTMTIPGQTVGVDVYEHTAANGDKEILIKVPAEVSNMKWMDSVSSWGQQWKPNKNQLFNQYGQQDPHMNLQLDDNY